MFKLRFLMLSLIMLTPIVQATQDMVVVRSQGTDLFPAGLILNSQTAFHLSPKAEVTVVFASGGIQTVKGPSESVWFTDPLPDNPADSQLITQLARFLTTQQEVVRSTSQQPEDVWVVDLSTTKRFYCIAPSNKVILWRPETQAQSASTLLIKHKPTDKRVQIEWPAHKTTLKWPDDLPVIYGDTYTVELKTRNSSSFKKLILYQLPESLPTQSHKVVWMVGRGCIPQANMLLASLR